MFPKYYPVKKVDCQTQIQFNLFVLNSRYLSIGGDKRQIEDIPKNLMLIPA